MNTTLITNDLQICVSDILQKWDFENIIEDFSNHTFKTKPINYNIVLSLTYFEK